MSRTYSGFATGPGGEQIPFSAELFGPPDAEGYVWLDPSTKIHERDLQEAFEAFKLRGGRVTAEVVPGEGTHVRAHGYSIGGRRK
jgi:hypothetical protein